MKISERRVHSRKVIDDSVLIHINTRKGSVEKSARIENISLGGICLKNLYEIDNGKNKPYLEGEFATVYFRSIPISIFGVVARKELGGRLALKIKQSTDNSLWEKINI